MTGKLVDVPDAKAVFSDDPQLIGPAILDFRLGSKSPCIDKASDGGDIGCRDTPEMIEMCKIARKLLAK